MGHQQQLVVVALASNGEPTLITFRQLQQRSTVAIGE